jgi:15-cis-phytoene synthase
MELDPDRQLALAYVAVARREAIRALWTLDAAIGAVLSGGREPMISQIRLAWWRQELERLDNSTAPAEPVLRTVQKHVLPLGISGAELSKMEEGWSVLLSPDPLTPDDLRTYGEMRGGLLFAFSARILGGEAGEPVRRGGEAWALVDLARHSNPQDARAALTEARSRSGGRTGWPSRLRPIGMLSVLARRDSKGEAGSLEAQGAPARMLRMLRHRITGR